MTEWVIVADSSPLIGLARIGQLEILRKLASRVLMPPAVRDEITQYRRDAPGAAIIGQAAWIEVEAPDHFEGPGRPVGPQTGSNAVGVFRAEGPAFLRPGHRPGGGRR
jgi:hypothetical protein